MHYPKTVAEFQQVLRMTNTNCASIVAGGSRYDPSIDSAQECGFSQWRGMPHDFCDL